MVGPAAGWQMSINFGCTLVPWFGHAGTPEWMCLSRTLETVDRFKMACNVPAMNFLAWASSAVVTLELSCTRRKLSRLPRQVSKCGDDCCKKHQRTTLAAYMAVRRAAIACNVLATNFLAWASSAVVTPELSCTRRKLSRLPRQVS